MEAMTFHKGGSDMSRMDVISPIDGVNIAKIGVTTREGVEEAIDNAERAFLQWRKVPAPKRGELIRLLGEVLRENKDVLGRWVTRENGKILAEGKGEVQEMIDMCDFAVGLSRQLYGLTMSSERPGHRMMETWHPLGPVAVISAFNFPVAVWAWNFALAIVCGNPVIWKPSKSTPFTAVLCQQYFEEARRRYDGDVPEHLSQVVVCGRETGELLVEDPRIKLVSATGSTAMGRIIAPVIAKRFGRAILELGGNNAAIIAPTADLDLAERAIIFSAVGTAGQRCTSLRRLFVHDSIYDTLLARLEKAYGSIRVGNPLEPETLVGPLINKAAFDEMRAALMQAANDGGVVYGGGRVLEDEYSADAYYVDPAIVEMSAQTPIVHEETFAPILYVMRYTDLQDAIAEHNAVGQGLSSCIFTNDVREAELFQSSEGSDCGIANVNIGPSGAEIGGAFGGEKDTGGGREAGSDSWKAYMRRATNTTNYSRELPLAQGIKFDLD